MAAAGPGACPHTIAAMNASPNAPLSARPHPSLPEPDAAGRALSAALSDRLRARIAAAGGLIGFDDFMRMALYEPELGYYAGEAHKFGQYAHDGSDFVTAPELSPLFGQACARQVAEVLRQSAPAVLEFGAGSGRWAVDLLNALGDECQSYAIVELSASLRARQRALIERDAPAHAHKLRWLDTLPDRFAGCVIGNEVLDAMPVKLIERADGRWCERGVTEADGHFAWTRRALDGAALAMLAERIPDADALPDGYVTEWPIEAAAFAATVARMLERGGALFIDYGFPADEFYHPHRTAGTLMCHVRHRAHDDPFWYPGLQDITAHVDFSSVAHAAVDAGADLAGYTTQARFLMNCGIVESLAQTGTPGSLPYAQATSAMLKLLAESEMGELFKVIGFARGLEAPWLGFARGDKGHTL